MKRSTKYILIIAGLFVAVVVAIAGYGLYTIYSTFRAFGVGREIPEALKEARVTTGSEFLHRSEFYKLEKSGLIKAIRDGSNIADAKEREKFVNGKVAAGIYNFADLKVFGGDVVAVAEFGAFVFDHQGNLKSSVILDPATERVKIGPFETDTNRTSFDNLQVVPLDSQRIGFLSRDLSQGMRVFDSKGTEIWSIGKKTLDLGAIATDSEKEFERSNYVLEAAVGDLNGDAISEYIVARNNDGIRVYDQAGNEKWFHAEEYPNEKLEVFDIDRDGKAELVVVGKGIFDGNGKWVREVKTRGDAFLFAENGKGFEVNTADFYNGKLVYSSENNDTVFSADAPLSKIMKPAERIEVPGFPEMSHTVDSDSVAFPRAALVSLRKGEPKYLAVIASFIGIARSNFYVYDQKGKLVYHELLPQDAETIAILPGNDDVDSILIGGKDTIWKYSVN